MNDRSAGAAPIEGISRCTHQLDVACNRIENIISRLEAASDKIYGSRPTPPKQTEVTTATLGAPNLNIAIERISRLTDMLEAAEHRINYGNDNRN